MSIWQTLSRKAAAAVKAGGRAAPLQSLGLDGAAKSGAGRGVAFTIALVALSAKMAKSDGFVTFDEVEAFGRVCHFAPSEAENVRYVFDLTKQDVAGYETYARQIAAHLADAPELRRDVLEGLYVIAAADGILHGEEDRYLSTVAQLLGIPPAEHTWIRSLFVTGTLSPYEVLGITPAASNSEIKSRYRALVVEHHPDRLMGHGVPAEFVTIAERKLASINGAYETIARERGL